MASEDLLLLRRRRACELALGLGILVAKRRGRHDFVVRLRNVLAGNDRKHFGH